MYIYGNKKPPMLFCFIPPQFRHKFDLFRMQHRQTETSQYKWFAHKSIKTAQRHTQSNDERNHSTKHTSVFAWEFPSICCWFLPEVWYAKELTPACDLSDSESACEFSFSWRVRCVCVHVYDVHVPILCSMHEAVCVWVGRKRNRAYLISRSQTFGSHIKKISQTPCSNGRSA